MKKELSIIIKYWDISLFLCQQDLKSRFRRSKLGIFWLVINQLSFSLGAGLIWSKILGTDSSDFIPFLAVGFALWTFISSSMIEGCSTFINAHNYIKQLPLPQTIFIMRIFLVTMSYFGISMMSALLVLLYFKKLSLIGLIYSLPGFIILISYFYGAIGTMGYLGIRYRDIQHGLPGVFSLLVMLTPVMYSPEILIKKGVAFVIYANPFASLIEVIRNPLLYNVLAPQIHYFTATGFACLMIAIRFILEKKWGRLVAFWS
jgi:ABC-type polysaccharide/polyol phosphate export permease